MSEYAIVVKGGDLQVAKKALEGLGAFNGRISSARYTDSSDDPIELLHIHLDGDDEGDIEGLFMVAPTPKESEITQISLVEAD